MARKLEVFRLRRSANCGFNMMACSCDIARFFRRLALRALLRALIFEVNEKQDEKFKVLGF